MKNYLLLLVAMLMHLPLCAQKHLEFNGLPIDGDMDTYVSVMERKGFSPLYRMGNTVKMKGKFTNQDVEIVIERTPVTKKVCRVCVIFPELGSWSELKQMYNEYTALYEQKYGGLVYPYSYHNSPYYEGDGREFEALEKGECYYETSYDAMIGTIKIIIAPRCLHIHYWDGQNNALYRKEMSETGIGEI